MSNYTYLTGYPVGNATPAGQRPTLQTNNDSGAGIWTEDHFGFNDNLGGTHHFSRYPVFSSPAVLSGTATQGSVVYTAAGTANSALPQAFFKDTNLSFQLNPIKAWAAFDGTAAGPIVPLNGINVSSISHTLSSGIYGVTLSTNAVFGTSFAVIVSVSKSSGSVVGMYQITGAGTFNIFTKSTAIGTPTDVDQVSFLVMQI